jgi:capsular exopolysaccharide synthesis family protein
MVADNITGMSEIFDFLKKTEAERNKKTPDLSVHLQPPVPAELPPEPEYSQVIKEPLAVEAAIPSASTFDLSHSSNQMLNVLDPLTVAGEQFRMLRTRLNLLQKQNGIKTVLVTSTVPQEGKSFTACGLAGVMAQEQGKRVVVIDGDLRKPGSGREFGLNGHSNETGVAQVLEGAKEFHSALISSSNPEFWFLPAGSLPNNPSELLSSPALEQIIKSASEMFDWVIVDSPPMMALSDATLIAPLCDTVLLVVRANSTPAKLVLNAVNKIGRERICGVVINRQKKIQSSRYYYQYYYRSSKNKKA